MTLGFSSRGPTTFCAFSKQNSSDVKQAFFSHCKIGDLKITGYLYLQNNIGLLLLF